MRPLQTSWDITCSLLAANSGPSALPHGMGTHWPPDPAPPLACSGLQGLGCAPTTAHQSCTVGFYMTRNNFQGPSIMLCSPQPTILSGYKNFCGQACLFQLGPACLSAVVIKRELPFWSCPHPDPCACSTVDPRVRSSELLLLLGRVWRDGYSVATSG